MEQNDEIFSTVFAAVSEPVHTNSHNHALVQNPFAWEDEAEQEEK